MHRKITEFLSLFTSKNLMIFFSVSTLCSLCISVGEKIVPTELHRLHRKITEWLSPFNESFFCVYSVYSVHLCGRKNGFPQRYTDYTEKSQSGYRHLMNLFSVSTLCILCVSVGEKIVPTELHRLHRKITDYSRYKYI